MNDTNELSVELLEEISDYIFLDSKRYNSISNGD